MYNFQIQPISTVVEEDWGSVVLRGIVPIVGVPSPDESMGGFDTEFGISDSIVQAIYVPKSEGGFSLGFGPQISLPTHTADSTKSSGLGGGFITAGFGFAGPLAYGVLVSHLWGEDDFNQSTIRPIVFYNLESPGIGPWFLGYNADIVKDWSRNNDDSWTVPLGLTVGKTILLPSEKALSLNLGTYDLVETPSDGNNWQLRFSANLLF